MKKPETLEECFKLFEKFEDINDFKEMTEESAIAVCHHTVGRSIRNDWGLWKEDSPLVKWFNEKKIYHADDMSSIIIISFHRKINGKDINLDNQIEKYIEYWAEMKRAKKTKYNFISSKKMGSKVNIKIDGKNVTMEKLDVTIDLDKKL